MNMWELVRCDHVVNGGWVGGKHARGAFVLQAAWPPGTSLARSFSLARIMLVDLIRYTCSLGLPQGAACVQGWGGGHAGAAVSEPHPVARGAATIAAQPCAQSGTPQARSTLPQANTSSAGGCLLQDTHVACGDWGPGLINRTTGPMHGTSPSLGGSMHIIWAERATITVTTTLIITPYI